MPHHLHGLCKRAFLGLNLPYDKSMTDGDAI